MVNNNFKGVVTPSYRGISEAVTKYKPQQDNSLEWSIR